MRKVRPLKLISMLAWLWLVGVVCAQVSDSSPTVHLTSEYSFNTGEAHSVRDLGIGTRDQQMDIFLRAYYEGSVGFQPPPEPKFIRPDDGIKSSENDKTT
jgi:hypothetical protein